MGPNELQALQRRRDDLDYRKKCGPGLAQWEARELDELEDRLGYRIVGERNTEFHSEKP